MKSPAYRVLCVEDDADTCELITIWLGMAPDEYDLVTVENPEDALRRIGSEHFDAYVIDSWLPGMSGTELCLTIRDTDPLTPIVFFSGVAYESEKAKAFAAGADAYLTKPAQAEEFVSTLQELVRRSRDTVDSVA